MSTNLIDNMTEREAKHLLNDICAVFKIRGAARTSSVILTNIKNSANDEFCRYKKVIKFLEGTIFRLIKKPNGYLFTTPGSEINCNGETIMEAVQKAIDYSEES